MRHSVDGTLEVLEVDTQPTMQMEVEVNPYLEVDASIADKFVEPSDSLCAGLDSRQGCIHRNTTVEPREGLYAKLGRAPSSQEKEPYTQLRYYIGAAATAEHADYIDML